MSVGVDVGATQTDSSTQGKSKTDTTSTNKTNTDINRNIDNFSNVITSGTSATDSKTANSSATVTDNAATQKNAAQTNQQTTGTVTSSAASIDAANELLKQARNNIDDPSATDSIVTNIIHQAAVAFLPTRVLQNQHGLYNSSTEEQLAGEASANASASAAKEVLDYKTGQQQIATNLVTQILGATKTSTSDSAGTTTGTTDTNGRNVAATAGNQNTSATQATAGTSGTKGGSTENDKVNSITDFISSVIGDTKSDTSGSSTTEKAGVSVSVLCTELKKQGKIDYRDWARANRQFQKYPEWGKQGYYLWAMPLLRLVQRDPSCWKAKFIGKMIKLKVNGNRPVTFILELTSCLLGLYLLAVAGTITRHGVLTNVHD